MNNQRLMQDIMRSSREYDALISGIASERKKAVRRPLAVIGLCEGAEKIFVTTLAVDEARSGERLLFLFATEKEAADEALRLSDEGIEAYHFPARDYNFTITTASRDYEHRRLLCLSRLMFSEEPVVICATAEAVLQITLPPEEMEAASIRISPEGELQAEALAEVLLMGGYSRVELVEGPGQFAIRGGIIDIFAPAKDPVRIELFGDEIDRIGIFDPITQRFTDPVDEEVIIPPAREIILSRERREMLVSAVEKQIAKIADKPQMAHTAELLLEEIGQLKSSVDVGFADKYLPLIYPGASCLFNYFDGTIVINNTSSVEEKREAAEKLTMGSIADMAENGEITLFKKAVYINDAEYLARAVSTRVSVLVDSFSRSHPGMIPGQEFNFRTRHIPSYAGNTALLIEDMASFSENGYRISVLCANEADAKSLTKELENLNYTAFVAKEGFVWDEKNRKAVCVMYGEATEGFELLDSRFAFLDYAGTVRSSQGFSPKKRKYKNKKNTKAILSYSDLVEGDYVVHEAYGIGLYQGIETLTTAGTTRDYVKIAFAGDDKLFLPVDQLDMVSKYIGASADGAVKLSKMGGADWHKAKSRASESAKQMAKELIELYARRRQADGYSFPEDDDMSRQFAEAFEYEETDSQLSAIEDISRDMEKPWPMERIICGDVGYGKTEVAFRAAFKAALGGKQVAILVPTTILAYQHYKLALSRFRGFPVSIDMLSRFRSKGEQEASLRKLRRGETDIVIGTHRLISKDVEFHDLGLVIIDEEQRFGVAQKEKLKELAIGADLLTLTATPIPRTLNMAMGGIMDMSILDDVPGLRSPVQTYVMEHDDSVICEALRRELRRGGQVFYLNNDIEYLYTVKSKLQSELPDAVIEVAHGRMDKEELEEIWASLVRGEIDILCCTTIIETGVDVPNANTLVIENADRFGLSQLHQIRGRVGRSSRRAYAYFTYPKRKQLTEIAEKRLSAMKEYAAFGAGFKIALRDLEIRGAGNLLGGEQHGHMEAVGYDMYIKLLEEAVLTERGEKKKPQAECKISISGDAFLPKSYIKDPSQRMEMYRKIARIQNEDDFSDMLDELCDRFGDVPRSALGLCRIALVRGLGKRAGFTKIEETPKDIVITTPTPDLSAIREIESGMPGSIRVNLAAETRITVRKPRSGVLLDWMADLINKYVSISDNKDGEEEQEQ